MEQHLLHGAVVHGEDTQTAVIIANDFIITFISSAIMNTILCSLSENTALCSKAGDGDLLLIAEPALLTKCADNRD